MARRKKLNRKSRQKLQRGFAIIALLALLAAIILVAVLDRRVTQQFEGRRWTLPARVYAQPLELYAGQNLSSARFAQELERLGYIPQTPVDRPGTFRRKGDSVDVYVREFRFSDATQPAQKLRDRLRRRSDLGAVRRRRRRRARFPPRPVADRQHLPDPRRGPDHRVAGRGAAVAAGGAQGRRRPQVRHAPRREPARDPARGVREPARGPGGTGRQHAHAAAGEELFPRQPAHAAAQGRGSHHGVHSRIAIREGGHHERLHQRDLPGPGRPPRGARLRSREPVLFRQAAPRAEPA